MGEKEFGVLKYYVQNVETGEFSELGKISDANIEFEEEEKRFFTQPISGTFTVNLTEHDVITFRRRFFPESINNWRKHHGLSVRRRKHLKRWHG